MQGLSIGNEMFEQDKNKNDVVETRDTVQEWWADIVEPLLVFATSYSQLSSSIRNNELDVTDSGTRSARKYFYITASSFSPTLPTIQARTLKPLSTKNVPSCHSTSRPVGAISENLKL
jgi:hypothetical protein